MPSHPASSTPAHPAGPQKVLHSFPREPPPLVVAIHLLSHVRLFVTHGLQHARFSCPLLSPELCSNSCPLSQRCPPTIYSSAIPFSCLQSFPTSGSFPMSQLFASGGQKKISKCLENSKLQVKETAVSLPDKEENVASQDAIWLLGHF